MAHIGVIEELEKNGFEISSIAGSSIGAVIGGIYALGKLTEYKNWVCELDRMDVFKLLDFTLTSQGFIKGEKVFEEIQKFIDDQPIENLKIPFVAIATDMLNHREVALSKGSMFAALRASIAIPTILTPYKLNGVSLVDGSVLNPVPLNHIERRKDDILVVVDLNAHPKKKGKEKELNLPEKHHQKYLEKIETFFKNWNKIFTENKDSKEKVSYFKIFNKVTEAMQAKISEMMLEQYKPDMIVRISKNSCASFDYHRAEELIELGRQNFKKSLESYKESLK